MVSACYYEPLRIQKRWQNYKLKQLVSDKTLNLFPLREKELKWCRSCQKFRKIIEPDNTDNKLYYLDVSTAYAVMVASYIIKVNKMSN